jgi:DUF2950 family protein
MRIRQSKIFPQFILPFIASVLVVSAWNAGSETPQSSFAAPKEAADALLEAAQKDDVGMLSKIFGPEAGQILNSGDAVQDKASRALFVERARQSMQVRINPTKPTHATILIGTDLFPFPVPLARTAGRWHFDTPAGKAEILARRIGSNELDAIVACKAYVAAQYDYASEDRNKNGIPEYAQKLISSPGKRDGLFWPGDEAPPTEFVGKVKKAGSEGYRKQSVGASIYHGYNFRILTAQGSNARSGALDYLQHGLMIGGFALVAWPAEYGVSGIETFLVNQDGVTYEKDLGPSTSSIALGMTAFDPDKTWRRVS